MCPTLFDPIDCTLLGSSVLGFPRQEYWSGSSFPTPGDLSDPGIKPWSPTLQVDSLLSELSGKLGHSQNVEYIKLLYVQVKNELMKDGRKYKEREMQV